MPSLLKGPESLAEENIPAQHTSHAVGKACYIESRVTAEMARHATCGDTLNRFAPIHVACRPELRRFTSSGEGVDMGMVILTRVTEVSGAPAAPRGTHGHSLLFLRTVRIAGIELKRGRQ